MNWITRNNYTIKRKFNQFNVDKDKKNKNRDNNIHKNGNGKEKEQNVINNKNQINYNINVLNQDNNKNIYTSMYYQINVNDNLEQQLKKGENIVQNNLNCKYILSQFSEF